MPAGTLRCRDHDPDPNQEGIIRAYYKISPNKRRAVHPLMGALPAVCLGL